MADWYIKNHRQEAERLKEETGMSTLASILLANRRIRTFEEAKTYFSPDLSGLHNPYLFQQMESAVSLIMDTLSSGLSIRIVGDYDQDGVAATTILVKGLRSLAEEMGLDPYQAVSYAIPDRVVDGYGINRRLVEEAKKEDVALIITCDNGIAAFDALDYAQEVGIPVIITDHHQIQEDEEGGEKVPACVVYLNPHSKNSGYPFPDLCGAGVAFKLIQAIYQELGEDFARIRPLLAYACLGTICDVVPLQGENRVLASMGLQVINEKPDPGIAALLRYNHWEREVDTYVVGFIIGPSINSSGRLMTARLGVELFLEDDPETIEAYAAELVALNNERKEMTRTGVEKATDLVRSQSDLDQVLVLYLPEVHESLCGLIAGRIKDLFYRPCLVFTDAEETGEGENLVKGSGRSIESYNIFEALQLHREDYVAFGGHAMACGMTLRKKDLNRMKVIWNREAKLSSEDLTPRIGLDASLPLSMVKAPLMRIIDHMAPFGMKNPKPVFGAKNLSIRQFRLVGKNKTVLQIRFEDQGSFVNGVLFQADEKLKSLEKEGPEGVIEDLLSGKDLPVTFDICYQPGWNEFRGTKSLQIRLVDIRFSRGFSRS